MKINIVTCHTPYNFGAVLQCYALHTYLNSQGHQTEVVDYVTPPIEQKNRVFSLARKLVRGIDFKRCEAVFGSFLRREIPLTPMRYQSFSELKEHPPLADAYIAGSDQIWNCTLKNGRDKAFYLSFAPPGRRKISYAASLAMEYIPQDMEEFYRTQLSQFYALSVREPSAVRILNKIGIAPVTMVLDPVYLLPRDEWMRFSDGYDAEEPYVLVYCFSRKPEYYEYAKKLARQRGLKIYIISNLWTDKRFPHDRFFWVPTPRRFISLFLHADCVVTNSFHGLTFSIMFGKEPHVFESLRGGIRIRDAVELFGLQNRMISENHEILTEPCDYTHAEVVRLAQIKTSAAFLNSALAGNDGEV